MVGHAELCYSEMFLEFAEKGNFHFDGFIFFLGGIR